MVITVLLFAFVAAEILYIKYSGKPVGVPDIPRSQQTLGTGKPLRYVVMGDSTAISQGGTYADGYAVRTAAYLAESYTVTWQNVAVSGARAHDVEAKQLPKALAAKPDIVLIAVGANDVTHLTDTNSVVSSLGHVIDGLRQQNQAVEIVLTGSPDMGSVPRFAQPARWLAGERTKTLNDRIIALAHKKKAYFAPIAAQTGRQFRRHPELFAADKFHPTTEGYKLWTSVIIKTLQDKQIE